MVAIAIYPLGGEYVGADKVVEPPQQHGAAADLAGERLQAQVDALRAKRHVYCGFCGVPNQRRMLKADGLAEGEELGSNILHLVHTFLRR